MNYRKEQENNHPTARPTYLYHKTEVDRRRKRMEDQIPSPPRLTPARDKSHLILRRNVRIAIITAFVMLGVLAAARTTILRSWQAQQQRTVRTRQLIMDQLPGIQPESENIEEPVTAIERLRGKATGPDDTTAMRQAVIKAHQGRAKAQEGAFEQALELYLEALDIWPYLAPTWADLGQAYLALGQPERALTTLKRAVSYEATPAALNDLGVAHMLHGQIPEARARLYEALELDNTYPEPYFNLALCEMTLKQPDKAREFLLSFIALSPNDARGLKELAYFDALEENYEAALDKLEAALAATPEWGALYFDAAAASALSGQTEQAADYLARAIPYSNPRLVFRIYQQSAFRNLRQSPHGARLEQTILDETRRYMDGQTSGYSPPPSPAHDTAHTAPLPSLTPE